MVSDGIRTHISTEQSRRRMGAGMTIKGDKLMELSEWILEGLLGPRALLVLYKGSEVPGDFELRFIVRVRRFRDDGYLYTNLSSYTPLAVERFKVWNLDHNEGVTTLVHVRCPVWIHAVRSIPYRASQ